VKQIEIAKAAACLPRKGVWHTAFNKHEQQGQLSIPNISNHTDDDDDDHLA
jgi:hypothetical protein